MALAFGENIQKLSRGGLRSSMVLNGISCTIANFENVFMQVIKYFYPSRKYRCTVSSVMLFFSFLSSTAKMSVTLFLQCQNFVSGNFRITSSWITVKITMEGIYTIRNDGVDKFLQKRLFAREID